MIHFVTQSLVSNLVVYGSLYFVDHCEHGSGLVFLGLNGGGQSTIHQPLSNVHGSKVLLTVCHALLIVDGLESIVDG